MNKTFSDFPTMKEKTNSIVGFASKVVLILNCLILLANLLIENLDKQDLTQRFIHRSNAILALSFLFVLIIRIKLHFEPESESLNLFLVLINLTLPFFMVSGTMRTIFNLRFDVIIFVCLVEISLRFYLLYELPQQDKAFQFSSVFTVTAISLISVAVHSRFNSSVFSYNLVNIFMHALVYLQSKQLKIIYIKDKLVVQAIKEKKQQVDSVLQALKIGFGFADESGNIRSNSIFNSMVGNKLDQNTLKTLLNWVRPIENSSDQVKAALTAVKKAVSTESLIIQLNPFAKLFANFVTVGIVENASTTVLLKLRFTRRKYKCKTVEMILVLQERPPLQETKTSESSIFEHVDQNSPIIGLMKTCWDLYKLDILKETKSLPICRIGGLFRILSVLTSEKQTEEYKVTPESLSNKWKSFFRHKIGKIDHFSVSFEPFVDAFQCNAKKLNTVIFCLLSEFIGMKGVKANLECKLEGNIDMEICLSISVKSTEIKKQKDSVFLKVSKELVKQLDSVLIVTQREAEMKFEFSFAAQIVASPNESFSSYFSSDISEVNCSQFDDLEEMSQHLQISDILWDLG